MARPKNKYLAMPYLIDGTDYPTDAEVEAELAGRNLTIQYQDDGIDVSTKGGIEYVNFTGAGVTAEQLVSGTLIVDIGLETAGEYVFFLEDTADGAIAGYKVMDNPAQLVAEAFVTESTIADGQIIEEWVTGSGLPGTAFIPDGTWEFKINGYKTGGTKEVRLDAQIYTRNLAGTETLLGTTASSIPLTLVEVAVPTFNIYISAVTLLDTDRIVVKVRMRLVGSGSNPTSVTVGYSGSTAARLQVPSQAIDTTTLVRTTGAQNVGGVKTFTDNVEFNQQQALQFRIENRTSDPGAPAVGQMWLRTDI